MAYKDKEKKREYNREYRLKNKDKRREYYLKNKDKINDKKREYHLKNKDKIKDKMREYNLKNKYNLTPEQYNQILANQDNKCAICNEPFKNKRNIHVDHNHLTGKVRGLLCSNCNTGIGLFKEDKSILKSAIGYLAKYNLKRGVL